ncbi:MAG: hypothetical protein P1U61_04595 [Legionellaceae bacterium]|nr:hypothetical protein [Legionellaceae bacterium]
MPSQALRETLEQNFLMQLAKKFRRILSENNCHPRGGLAAGVVEEHIKAIIDWPSIEPLFDENIEALSGLNVLPSPAKKPFLRQKYQAFDAMPSDIQDAFSERVVGLYQSEHSTSSEVDSELSSSEQRFVSLSLSEEDRAIAHQHFVSAIAEERRALDMRVYHTDDRGVRRYDSLTRVLSFHGRNSVCAAVTVHDNRLIASANSTGELSSDTLAQAIRTKLNILRTFLDDAEVFIDEDVEFQAEVDRVARLLVEEHGISGTSAELKQALKKLYRSSQGEPSDLLEEEAFLLDAIRYSDEFTVLLPSWKKTTEAPQVVDPGVREYQLQMTTGEILSQQVHPFDEALQFSGHEKIASFHAEQLLVVYFERVLGVDLRSSVDQRIFGISKLTCADCAEAMASRQVRTRGTSGAAYDAVANVTSPNRPSGRKRRRPVSNTAPDFSPPDSSMKASRVEQTNSVPSEFSSTLIFEQSQLEEEQSYGLSSVSARFSEGLSDVVRDMGLFSSVPALKDEGTTSPELASVGFSRSAYVSRFVRGTGLFPVMPSQVEGHDFDSDDDVRIATPEN